MKGKENKANESTISSKHLGYLSQGLKRNSKIGKSTDLLNSRKSINNMKSNGKSLLGISNPYKNTNSGKLLKTK